VKIRCKDIDLDYWNKNILFSIFIKILYDKSLLYFEKNKSDKEKADIILNIQFSDIQLFFFFSSLEELLNLASQF
jgi:hypothetical protein